jgi:hypothetical protein
MENAGTLIIKTANGRHHTQYFWDDASGFWDKIQEDGSWRRYNLDSPRHARYMAWLATYDAMMNGHVVDAIS